MTPLFRALLQPRDHSSVPIQLSRHRECAAASSFDAWCINARVHVKSLSAGVPPPLPGGWAHHSPVRNLVSVRSAWWSRSRHRRECVIKKLRFIYLFIWIYFIISASFGSDPSLIYQRQLPFIAAAPRAVWHERIIWGSCDVT